MIFKRKYNTLTVTGTTAIRIPLLKRGVVDYAVGADWTPAAGDVKFSIDGAAPANVTNLPVATTFGNTAVWEFILTAAELTGKQCVVTISDSATKAVEDDGFIVETFGHASAMYQADFSLANLPANVTQLLGTAWLTPGTAGTPDVNVKLISDDAVAADNAEKFFDGTGYAGTNNVIPTVTTVTNGVTVTTNNDKTGYTLTQTFPANFAALGINASGHISRVTLVDTTTTNTDMRGTDGAYTGTPPTAAAISTQVNTDITTAHGSGSYLTATGFSTLTQADIRTAVGLATANLDTQLGDLPTNSEVATAGEIADEVRVELTVELDHIDADISSRMATFTYTTPPTPAEINTLLVSEHGDGDWITATGFSTLDAAGVRAAVGLASANLDTQLGAIALTSGLTAGATYATAGTVVDAGPTATQFKTSLTEVDGFWNDTLIVFQSGGLYRQTKPVKAYVQSNGTITLDTSDPFTSAPANGDQFFIKATHVHPISQIQAGLATSIEIEVLTKLAQADMYIDKNTTPWELVYIESGTGGIGVGVELMRKKVRDVDGNAITDTQTVIGQEHQ